MEQDFDRALAFVLAQEGGFSDEPGDRGGPTNLGITQGSLDSWRRANPACPASVRDLTRADAAAIYRARYWSPIHGDWVAWPLCLILFDTAVNCGVGRACALLNGALGLGSAREWTPATSDAYQALASEPPRLLTVTMSVAAARRRFYEALATQPGQARFLRGWLARMARLETEARAA